MTWNLDDVIVALGSPPGPAPRGLIRATGPTVRAFLDGHFQPDDLSSWQHSRLPRRHVGRLSLPSLRIPIPVAVHDWPTVRSYTGQPLVELHLSGSPPLLDAVLTAWCGQEARLARPGEFTLRAFLAGKLDLLQAEAVLGVIDAGSTDTLRLALDQLAGGISQALSATRHDLLNLLADVEAGLDFVEEHLEFVSRQVVQDRVRQARRWVEQLAQHATSRLQHGERPRVVLAGLPNAGKSTLFNALAGNAAALVSAQAGTTRDFLEARIQCDGQEFDLIDTAGWEETTSAIGSDAQRQRAEQLSRAALMVWCCAADATPEEREIDAKCYESCASTSGLQVMTKVDCCGQDRPYGDSILRVSAQTGEGLDALRKAMAQRWRTTNTSVTAWLGTSAARCQESVQATLASLESAERAASDPVIGDEIIAMELRTALDHLGRIVGAVYTDDLLDRIFSRFCIGK